MGTEQKVKSELSKGMVVGLAEIRGAVSENISWIDKKTGGKREAAVVKVQAEFSPLSSSAVQVAVSMDGEAAKKYADLLKKGTLVVFHLTGLQRQAGAWSAKAESIEPYIA